MKMTVYVAGGLFLTVSLLYLGLSAATVQGQQSRQSETKSSSESAQTSYDREIARVRARMEAEIKQMKEAENAEQSESQQVTKNRQQEELGYVPSGDVNSGAGKAELDKRIVDKEKAIRRRYESTIQELEAKKTRPAARPAERPVRPQAGDRSSAPAASLGVVTGIVHCRETAAALVDGRIFHKGDTIHDVKIISITPDAVEFEKAGAKWRQRVRQSPAPQWQPPQPRQPAVQSDANQADANQRTGSRPVPDTSAGRSR